MYSVLPSYKLGPAYAMISLLDVSVNFHDVSEPNASVRNSIINRPNDASHKNGVGADVGNGRLVNTEISTSFPSFDLDSAVIHTSYLVSL